jgi:hypothetical protein
VRPNLPFSSEQVCHIAHGLAVMDKGELSKPDGVFTVEWRLPHE